MLSEVVRISLVPFTRRQIPATTRDDTRCVLHVHRLNLMECDVPLIMSNSGVLAVGRGGWGWTRGQLLLP